MGSLSAWIMPLCVRACMTWPSTVNLLRALLVPEAIHEMWLKGDRSELQQKLRECGLDKDCSFCDCPCHGAQAHGCLLCACMVPGLLRNPLSRT